MNKKSIIYRCLVASLCIVSLVVMTYSWFDRSGSADANSMGFTRTVSLNEDMTYIDAETSYSVDKGLNYSKLSTQEASTAFQNITTNLAPGDKIYFKTIVSHKVIGEHKAKPAKVSVKLENSRLDAGIRIGTVSPLNSQTIVSGSATSFTLVENVSVPTDSNTTIEWYIAIPNSPDNSTDATAMTIELGNLCIYQV
ncbi:MAG: hypothetical protein PUE67_06830 [Oscillospiraceae bacterium]|nr:hypothetical protein [Oscillospiraceae bacterium]